MTDETPPSSNIAHNDVEAALSIVRWYLEHGVEMSQETAEGLGRIQDDPLEPFRRWVELEEQHRRQGP